MLIIIKEVNSKEQQLLKRMVLSKFLKRLLKDEKHLS